MSSMVSRGMSRIVGERGYKASVIAQKCGFTAQQFSDMLNDRKVIRADYLPRIAVALGVSVQDIFDAGRDEK